MKVYATVKSPLFRGSPFLQIFGATGRIWHWPLSPWELQLGATKLRQWFLPSEYLTHRWQKTVLKDDNATNPKDENTTICYCFFPMSFGPKLFRWAHCLTSEPLEVDAFVDLRQWSLWRLRSGSCDGYLFDLAFGSCNYTFKENSDILF